MPTLEDVRRLATNFETAYPYTLARRLAWWVKVLGVNQSRFIQLIQFRADKASRLIPRTWQELVRANRKDSVWVEELLGQIVARYSYDWEALAEDLNEHSSSRFRDKSRGIKPFQRSVLTVQKPYIAHRSTHLSTRDQELLKTIYKGGRQSLEALFHFLAKR